MYILGEAWQEGYLDYHSGALADVKYVIMYRDLRDVAVSHYYYAKQTPWHPEYTV